MVRVAPARGTSAVATRPAIPAKAMRSALDKAFSKQDSRTGKFPRAWLGTVAATFGMSRQHLAKTVDGHATPAEAFNAWHGRKPGAKPVLAHEVEKALAGLCNLMWQQNRCLDNTQLRFLAYEAAQETGTRFQARTRIPCPSPREPVLNLIWT